MAEAIKMYGTADKRTFLPTVKPDISDAGLSDAVLMGFILSSNPGLREVSQTKMPH